MNKYQGEHISVCICTYMRPVLLGRLLKELQYQITNNLFTYSVVVVDNDHKQSAKSTVESFKENGLIEIEYRYEPERNFALVRNMAVKSSKGNYIAFIDDDELPVKNWLLNLYNTLHEYKADGVLGPVKPDYVNKPPKWLVKGRFCERPSRETGTILSSKDTRTGNVLIKYEIFQDPANMFDPEYGTGSEDTAFFRYLIRKGHLFVACKEAPVYEHVPPERMKMAYFLKRALLDGANASKMYKELTFRAKILTTVKSILALSIYTFMLPLTIFRGYALFMKILVKDCNHISKIFSLLGINIIKDRNF